MHLLGAEGVSLRVCRAADPSKGPWEPGALRAALTLGGKQPLEERCTALLFPRTDLFLLEPLAVCKPPAPKPSSRTPGA